MIEAYSKSFRELLLKGDLFATAAALLPLLAIAVVALVAKVVGGAESRSTET